MGSPNRFALAALLAACLAAPAAAPAAVAPGDGHLSPRLALLAGPALRGDSPREQARALGLAADGPGSLVRDAGRVLVQARFDRGAIAGLADLRAAGARIVGASRRYQTVTVAVRPADLRAVGAVPRLGSLTEVLAPVTRAADCGGAVRSEGDGQLRAADARAAFGVDGHGVAVGILSDSFDRSAEAATHAADDVASGDLPGPGSPCGSEIPVPVLDDGDAEGRDEGRAMAQIVHDLAPGASIAFSSATSTLDQYGFAAAIRSLHAAGASVLADDILYLDEPFFQDGPVAAAIDDVTAAGTVVFSAAGNDNVVESGSDKEIGSWEAPSYRDAGECPAAIVALSEEFEALEEEIIEEEEELEAVPEGLRPTHCMDFDPAGPAVDKTLGITVPAGGTLLLDLQWAEPWFGVETDIDAFLLDKAGELAELEGFPIGSAADNVNGSEEPFEYFFWENTGPEAKEEEVQLVVNRYSGSGARLKLVLVQSDVTALEYPDTQLGDVVGPTVVGHAGGRSAVAAGAIPYSATAAPEKFSSRGPLTLYFGPVRDASPAAPIPPDTISKPDLVATDGGVTTFFASSIGGLWRFFGTSASAPHAAAVAALMREANPSLTPGQLREALGATAVPVGAYGPEAVGAGMVDAYGAVGLVALPPAISIVERPGALSRNRWPRIGFAANRPVDFSCALDGGGPQPCGSPFVPSAPLADGEHAFAVSGTDAAGRVGTSETVRFEVDTRRPNTFFRHRPRKRVRTRWRRAKAVFRFGSNERGVEFICRIDGGPLRICGRRLARRFRRGRHVVRVKARDRAGNVDRSPAVYRFRVKGL